jgi:hypothetical protein
MIILMINTMKLIIFGEIKNIIIEINNASNKSNAINMLIRVYK